MGPRAEFGQRIRFGEFQLDPSTRELWRNGQKFSLQEQPFQILTALLERPGQLISREDLRKRLWSSSTFVDFEHGLNKAMNRLREVLEDSADQPRFIETLPRRGYRFIAPVEWVRKPSGHRARGPGRTQRGGAKFCLLRGFWQGRKFLTIACWTFWAAVGWESFIEQKT